MFICVCIVVLPHDIEIKIINLNMHIHMNGFMRLLIFYPLPLHFILHNAKPFVAFIIKLRIICIILYVYIFLFLYLIYIWFHIRVNFMVFFSSCGLYMYTLIKFNKRIEFQYFNIHQFVPYLFCLFKVQAIIVVFVVVVFVCTICLLVFFFTINF